MLDLSLSEKEKLILSEIIEGKTFSYVVRRLSKNYSESTVKYILRKLKGKGLINCGSSDDRGIPVSYTILGSRVCEILGSSSNGRMAVSNSVGERSSSMTGKTADGGSNPSDPTKRGGENA